MENPQGRRLYNTWANVSCCYKNMSACFSGGGVSQLVCWLIPVASEKQRVLLLFLCHRYLSVKLPDTFIVRSQISRLFIWVCFSINEWWCACIYTACVAKHIEICVRNTHTHIEYSYCLIFCMCRLMNNSISFFVYYPRLLLYALSGTKVRLAQTSAPQGSSVWMTAAAVNGGCDPPPGQSVTLQCILSSSLPPSPPPTTTASTPAVCSLGPSASCLLRLRTVINRQSKLRPFFSSPSAVSHKHKPPMPPPGILEMSEELSQGFPAPVKLSQTCKTEPLMKYINLEHCACIHSIVLFAYKPPCGGGGKEERLRGGDTLDKHVIEGKECAATWWLGNTDASQCLLQGLNRWNALSDTTDTTDREEEGGEKKKQNSLRITFVWPTPPMCPQTAGSEWAIVCPAFLERL